MLHIEEGKKDAYIIFETLTKNMKEWRLDFNKYVGFGSDRTSTMIGKQNGVAARLKEKINHFLISVHSVIHRTNFVAIDVTKVGPCKDMSREIVVLLNSVAMHFKKSYKRKKNTLL